MSPSVRGTSLEMVTRGYFKAALDLRFPHLVVHVVLEVALVGSQRLPGPTILEIYGIALKTTELPALGRDWYRLVSVMIDVEVTSKHDRLVMIHGSKTLLGSNDDQPNCVNPKVKEKLDMRVRRIVGAEVTSSIEMIMNRVARQGAYVSSLSSFFPLWLKVIQCHGWFFRQLWHQGGWYWAYLQGPWSFFFFKYVH